MGVGADEDESDKLCCNHLLYYVSIKGVVENKIHFSIKGECWRNNGESIINSDCVCIYVCICFAYLDIRSCMTFSRGWTEFNIALLLH